MATIWRRMKLMMAGTTPARRFQEEADVGVVAVLSCFRGLKLDPANAEKEHGQLFEEAVAFIEKKKFEQQKQYVQEQVEEQVQRSFDAMLRIPRESQNTQSKISLSGFERTNDVADKLGMTENLQDLLGFTLKVEQSSVPNAGQGVKLRGAASIGSLVALFPGTVYLSEHYKKPEHLQELSNNPFARARFDSVIINGKNASSTPHNELAVAHKINHPPAGTTPNVVPFAFDFPLKEPFTTEEYLELTPNSFVATPSRLAMFGKRVVVHGLAFIATEDIEDEDELFLNYRYNPDHVLPDWYTPVDVESDRAMWK